MRIGRSIWIGIFFAHWAYILFFWAQGSGALFFEGYVGVLIAFGRLMGLAAAYAVLVQFFLVGRFTYIERFFGFDALSRIHHLHGRAAVVALLLHPLFLVLGYRAQAGVSAQSQFSEFIFHYPYVGLAFAGLIGFLVVVGTSIAIVRLRLKYETWHAIHLVAYLSIFASFWHQISVGSTVLSRATFYWYWVGLFAYVLASHLVFRFVRPVYRYARHQFRVSRVVRESEDAVSIYITGRDLDAFRIIPGQFMFVRFLKSGFWRGAHPFSLSMPARDGELRITIKELGDFTKKIKDVSVGTPIMIDGPYGIFIDQINASKKILLIAGGIGITPIRSLMEDMLSRGKDVVLLYGNRTRKNIVFEKELGVIASRHNSKVVHVMSEDEYYEGEKGRIDAVTIQRLVPDVATREVYLCGPPPMMRGVRKALVSIGMPKNRVHFEKFSLP